VEEAVAEEAVAEEAVVAVEEVVVAAVAVLPAEEEVVVAAVAVLQPQVSEAPSPEKLSSRNLKSVEETRATLQPSRRSHSPQPSQSGP